VTAKTEVLEQPQVKAFHNYRFERPVSPQDKPCKTTTRCLQDGGENHLKSEGRRSVRLHFSHSAWFLTLPFSKTVFILISPPQEQKNFWVALEVRAFLLAWAISFLLAKGRQKSIWVFEAPGICCLSRIA
jgi:hypothetical protein